MTCPDELTCALYADGELLDAEANFFREHLGSCSNCRELVAAVQEENRALVHAIQGLDQIHTPQTVPARQSTTGLAAELAIAVVGLASALRIGLDYANGIETPVSLHWLSPFRFSGQLNFLMTSLVYLIQGGGALLTSLVTDLSVAVFVTMLVAAALALPRRSTQVPILLITIFLLSTFSLPSYAIDIRGNRLQTVTISASETVDDTLVASGDSVIVDGTITGDLIAAARRVMITGTVQGDVLCAARNVEIGGTVQGNIYAVGESMRIAGLAERNLYSAGRSINVIEGTEVRGNMAAAGETIAVDGQLGRDLMAAGQEVEVRGAIGRGIRTYAERVVLLPSARVGGDLRANVPSRENVQIENGASIAGRTDIRVSPPRPNRYSTISYYVFRVVRLAVAFVTGLVFFWIFPFLSQPILDNRSALLKTGALGFVAAITVPVAAIVAALTIVGIPIALFTIIIWAFGLYLAKVVLGVFFGRALLSGSDTSVPVALLVGLILITIAIDLPYVGTLINIILTLLGFGALLFAGYRRFRPVAVTPRLQL